jgi:transposase
VYHRSADKEYNRKDKREAAVEAGRSSYTMVDLLEELGVDVKMVHRLGVKAIAQAKIKTDKKDSKILAHLLRADLILAVYRRETADRAFQLLLRHRMYYIRMQTQIKNQIQALLEQQREEVAEIVERQS